MLEIKKFVFSVFQVNTYLVFDSESKEGAVIDPGCSNLKEERILLEAIEKENIILKYVVNTHLHIDHIFGNALLKEKFNVLLAYSHGDEFLLPIMQEEAQKYGVSLRPVPNADIYLEELDYLEISGVKFNLLYTPGHSPGEYSLFSSSENICFSGDVLFKESIGRTDLWQGDYDTLVDSIYNKLFILPDDVTVYPGHGPSTTIGYEKKFNPFL